jgi:hypothetical protein
MNELSTLSPMPLEGALWSGFDGANRSPMRGEVWWQTLETKDELDSYSREELQRKIRWANANTGIIRGFINNGADLIGFQRPRVLSEDAEWVIAAQESIAERMLTPELFDFAGDFDLEDAQPMLNRAMLKDADALAVFTNAKDGGSMVAFYEAHQLCNPTAASSNWRDGVRYEGSRKVAYGVKDPASGKVKVIDAKHCFYYAELESPGHGRAIPRLAHAVNNAIDITETRGFVKAGIKTASLFGAVIENPGQHIPAGRQGMVGGLATGTNGVTGEKFEVARVWNPAQVTELAPGRTMKVLSDARPHPNQMEFEAALVREMSIGFGLHPEVIYHMQRLTGPGVRFVLDVTDRWIKARQKIQKRFVTRVVRRYLACEIDRGRLPMPKDGIWWRLKMVPQRSLTIDRGQVSRARLDEIDAGVGTWEGWEEIDEMPWQDRADQRMREFAYVKATAPLIGKEYGVELKHDEVFRGRQGAAAMPAAADEKDTKKKDESNDQEEP